MKPPKIISRKAREHLLERASSNTWVLPRSCLDRISKIAASVSGFAGSDDRPMRVSDYLDFNEIRSIEGEVFEFEFPRSELLDSLEDFGKSIPPNIIEQKTDDSLRHLENMWVYNDYLFDLIEHRQFGLEEHSLLIMEAVDKERKRFEKLKLKFSGVKVERKRERIPESVRISVWQRDGGKCVECGSNENLEYDHIIPFSRGGSNTVRNIQLLCESCNRTKGANL